jgi:hypothetical protein
MQPLPAPVLSAAIVECETAELNDFTGTSALAQRYVKHLLLHLINDDIEHARHLWRRIDPTLQAQSPELANVWAVAERLWEGRDVPGAFDRLLATGAWSAEAQPLVSHLAAAVRKTQVVLISQGFTIVSEEYALRALGLADSTALHTEFGWGTRPDGMLEVARPAPSLPVVDGS